MKTRFTLTFSLVLAIAAGACADDVQSSIGSRKPRSSGAKQSASDAPSSAGTSEPPTTSSDADDANDAPPAPPPQDADAGPPPPNAFTATSPYALLTPSEQSADHHGGTSNAGKDCLLCHTGQGAPRFVVAGTIFTTKGSTTPAAGVQVRVVSPAGQEIALVGTDESGNFWLEGTASVPPGSHVGVRDATRTKLMNGPIGVGTCNQSVCHVTSAQPPIFLSD